MRQERQLHDDAGHDLAVAGKIACARQLAEMIAARYPDRTVHVVGDAAYVGERLRRSARANPSASPDQRALVNNRCARL